MILLIYLIFTTLIFYTLLFKEKLRNENTSQNKKETEELKNEWKTFLKEDMERYYPNKYKKFWDD